MSEPNSFELTVQFHTLRSNDIQFREDAKTSKRKQFAKSTAFPKPGFAGVGPKKTPISMISWLLDGLLSKSGCGFLHLDSGNADVVPWDLG